MLQQGEDIPRVFDRYGDHNNEALEETRKTFDDESKSNFNSYLNLNLIPETNLAPLSRKMSSCSLLATVSLSLRSPPPPPVLKNPAESVRGPPAPLSTTIVPKEREG